MTETGLPLAAAIRPGGAKPLRAKPFRLARYFALSSLAIILVLLPVLLGIYRHLAFQALRDQQARKNVALAQLFANTTWTRYNTFIRGASSLTRGEVLARPEIARLRAEILEQMHGLDVVKVKLYGLNGMTVFSTEEAQIGEDRGKNSGFASAVGGTVATAVVFREQFSAFEETIFNRDLVSTYLPIRRSHEAPVEGVIEVYADVTDAVRELEATQWKIVGTVVAGLALIYLVQFLLARKAEELIAQQAEEVRQAHEALLRYQERHDPLTGLPTRLDFEEDLDRELKVNRRNKTRCAVFAVGFDRFKEINDSYGHPIGDALLREAAMRLRSALRETDLAARSAGDEFLVSISGLTGVDVLAGLAEKVRQAILTPGYSLGGHELLPSASLGIAVSPDDGNEAAEMIRSAGAALHHAKTTGRGRCEFHAPEMNRRALHLIQMETRIRQAIDSGSFSLAYQPQVDLATGAIVGAEALLRWNHEELGNIPPAEFIPVAEERGLIVPLGNWVLDEACRQHRAWRTEGLPPIAIAVNTSPRQFATGDVVREAIRCLARHGMPAGLLELEVTESTTMDGTADVLRMLHALREAGIRLSLDDFGTGYSSLSLLKRLPIDRVKIDQSFVRGLPADEDDIAIASVVIEMGKALGLKVLAEGVETVGQLDFLRLRGCHEVQGFYFARPLPPDDFARFFLERTAPLQLDA